MKMISLTLAQYRMLGRLVRGTALTLDRYRLEHATIASLFRKKLVEHGHLHGRGGKRWFATDLGKQIFASRGVLRPGHSVWDSASHNDREAYKLALRRGEGNDAANILRDRMAEAGELPA